MCLSFHRISNRFIASDGRRLQSEILMSKWIRNRENEVAVVGILLNSGLTVSWSKWNTLKRLYTFFIMCVTRVYMQADDS